MRHKDTKLLHHIFNFAIFLCVFLFYYYQIQIENIHHSRELGYEVVLSTNERQNTKKHTHNKERAQIHGKKITNKKIIIIIIRRRMTNKQSGETQEQLNAKKIKCLTLSKCLLTLCFVVIRAIIVYGRNANHVSCFWFQVLNPVAVLSFPF